MFNVNERVSRLMHSKNLMLLSQMNDEIRNKKLLDPNFDEKRAIMNSAFIQSIKPNQEIYAELQKLHPIIFAPQRQSNVIEKSSQEAQPGSQKRLFQTQLPLPQYKDRKLNPELNA